MINWIEIYYYILPFLHVWLVCIFWFRFEPLQIVIETTLNQLETKWGLEKYLLWTIVRLLLQCPKCFTFWFSLLWLGNFTASIILSMLMEINPLVNRDDDEVDLR